MINTEDAAVAQTVALYKDYVEAFAINSKHVKLRQDDQ